MPGLVVKERPDSRDAVQLILELEEHLAQFYQAASRHGYSVEKLLQESVSFFVLRHEGVPVGCVGVQFYGKAYAELKRMYVRPQYRGMGFAKCLLEHVVEYCRQHDMHVLRLETGIYQEAAIHLYERVGFKRIPPFGDYPNDPLSVFFEKALS